MLPLLIYTLIGEFYAIVTDNIVGRFKFWIALVFDFVMLGFMLFAVPTQNFFDQLGLLFVFLLWQFFFWIPFRRYVYDLFHKYIKHFPSRFIDIPKEYVKLLFPSYAGYFVLFIPFLIAYYFLVFKV